MLTRDTVLNVPKLARSEHGLPRLFLEPERPVTLFRSGEKSVHLRSLEDVEWFALNPEVTSGPRPFSRRAIIAPSAHPHPLEYALWFMDLPDHKQHRAAVKGPFLQAGISRWEPLVRRAAASRIDVLRRRGTDLELASDFGQPFALSVISEILGAGDEVEDFFLHLARVTELEKMNAYPPEAGLTAILDRIIGEHLGRPSSHGAFGDLLTRYSAGTLAPTDEQAHHILRGYLASLLFAGTDTVAMTLGNVLIGLREWARWDEAVDAARSDDKEHLEALISEAFRLDLAFPASAARVVAETTTPSGMRLPDGTMVVAWYSAANRGSRFEQPNTFVVDRPEKHLGFGLGYHYCLGAPLAMLELVIAVQMLLTELPGLHITGKPRYRLGRVKRLQLPCAYRRSR